ncbi:DUF4926 domain-containing protein [Kineosporia babensis]|uniref:DUF4926 domain-containing protein n=1 Tax=Kineosporia babensis TaxID=499548 RepID=A0A9X1N9D6_9ACTN|nr:DUF4926 domain-containing protein [Kineosporia babensis]
MLHNFDLVSLSVTLPEHGLLPGALGTVVQVITDPAEAYGIEFGGPDGLVPSQVMVAPDQVRRLS